MTTTRFLTIARRLALGVGVVIAVLAVLLVLLYAEEDWRGARDWASCQCDLRARGESLDLHELAPPGAPRDDLSKVPIFAELYQQPQPAHPRLDRIDAQLGAHDGFEREWGNYQERVPIDLAAWQHFFRSFPQAHLPAKVGTPSQDVLLALSQFDPEMSEVKSAMKNPQAFWPIDYAGPFATLLAPVTRMLRVTKVLPLTGAAYLENRQTDLAEQEYLLSFRINQPLARNCFLVNYLVIIADRAIADGLLWEGIHRHAWNISQLQEMGSNLAANDMLMLAQKMLRVERASVITNVHLTQRMSLAELTVTEPYASTNFWYLLHSRPRGWWDEDRKGYTRHVQKLIDAIDPARGTVSTSQREDLSGSFSARVYTPITAATDSNFHLIPNRITQAETNRRLARIACRLEEYYLAHQQQYPETLAELPDLPPHLNQEVLTTKPLHYQRKGSGYLLYSTGWDQVDHGGVRKGPGPGQGEWHRPDWDWVWPSP